MKWKVTAARPATRGGMGTAPQAGYDLTVEADNGFTDTLFVPMADFNPAAAREHVAAHMEKVAAVHGLEGETGGPGPDR